MLSYAMQQEIGSSTVTVDINPIYEAVSDLSSQLNFLIQGLVQRERRSSWSEQAQIAESVAQLVDFYFVTGWLGRFHHYMDVWINTVGGLLGVCKTSLQLQHLKLQNLNPPVTKRRTARMEQGQKDMATIPEALTQLEQLQIEHDDLVSQWEKITPLEGLEHN